MKRIILSTLAALVVVVGALSSTPAEARCWWNGWGWECWHPHPYWHHPHYWHHSHYWHRW